VTEVADVVSNLRLYIMAVEKQANLTTPAWFSVVRKRMVFWCCYLNFIVSASPVKLISRKTSSATFTKLGMPTTRPLLQSKTPLF
jgi:hypothetical protein